MRISFKFSENKHAATGWSRVTSILYRVLTTSLGLAAISLAVVYLASEKQAWEHLRQAEEHTIILVAVILLLMMVLNSLVTRDLVAHFGIQLRIIEWIGITFVASLFNYITPFRGGAAVRAVYLKKYHRLPYAKFVSTLATTIAYSLLINAALAGICIILLNIPGGVYGWLVLAVCFGLVISMILGLRFAPQFSTDRRKGIVAKIASAAEGWHTISKDRWLRKKLLTWMTLNASGNALAFFLAFRMAGWRGERLVPVVSATFAKIGSFITVTPGALGIYEAFGAVSARLMGGELAISLLAVLVIRVLATLIVLIVCTALLPLLVKEWRLLSDPIAYPFSYSKESLEEGHRDKANDYFTCL